MRKFLASLAFLALFTTACVPGNWKHQAVYVNSRVVRIEHPVDLMMIMETGGNAPDIFTYPEGARAVCSGFVINEWKEYVLTANHCAGPNMTADGKPANIVFQSKEEDLMVIRVEKLNKPALLPADSVPEIGEPIAAVGYGYGENGTLFRAGVVANQALKFPELTGTYLIFSGPYIGGMSGGPVVDQYGDVVGIVQMSDEKSGFGRTIVDILKVTKDYWGN